MAQSNRLTKRIALPAVLATRDPTVGKDGILTNCYSEESKTKKRIVKRPGIEFKSNLGGNCVGQGAYYFVNVPVFIACDELHVNLPPRLEGVVGTGQAGNVSILGSTVTICPRDWQFGTSTYPNGNMDWRWSTWTGSVFVVAPHNSYDVIVSSDGLVWTVLTLASPPGNHRVTGAYGLIAWTGYRIVVPGTRGTGSVSQGTFIGYHSVDLSDVDGLSWTMEDLPLPTFGPVTIEPSTGYGPSSMAASGPWVCIIYRHVVLGIAVDALSIYSLTDGLTWSAGTTLPGSHSNWFGIGGARVDLGADPGFVAVGYNSDLAASGMGSGWFPGYLPLVAGWDCVCHNGTIWIALSDNTYSAWSTNGITWTLGSTIPLTYYGGGWAQAIWVAEVGAFYALSHRSQMMITSRDGITWKVVSSECDYLPGGTWSGLSSNGSVLVITQTGYQQSATGIIP